jgi:molybdate transport system substrate-binding protein
LACALNKIISLVSSKPWRFAKFSLYNKAYCSLLFIWLSCNSQAEQALIAVASNFNAAMNLLAPAFTEATGHQLIISFGSTGKLYAQIAHGAPYEVFLSADNSRTQLAIEAGLAVAGSDVVYAIGQLVLWSADTSLVDDAGKVLNDEKIQRIALANPKTAPYGAAAMTTLKSLGLADKLSAKLVQAESIAQAFQFVATRNAQLGFVALSQLKSGLHDGSAWIVNESLYAPLVQQAVLLKKGQHNIAAQAFLDYLLADEAINIIKLAGYKIPGNQPAR